MIHSFPFYIADWRDSKARMRMNRMERCLYLELIVYCWGDGVLPSDEPTLIAISGFTKPEFAKAWPKVQAEFTLIDGEYHHHKIDGKRPEVEEAAISRSHSARKAAQARWAAQQDTPHDADAMRDACATQCGTDADLCGTTTLSCSPSVSDSLSVNGTHTPEVRTQSAPERIDPDAFERITEQIWAEHPQDRRGTIQECRQYASQALNSSVNGAVSIEAAGRNHRLWMLVYTAGGYSHSLENWWAKGHWAKNPGQPATPRKPVTDAKMEATRALRAAKREGPK